MEELLQVKDLSISFHTYNGEVQAVRNASFDLHRKEVLAIVGESGSGKSVTMQTVLKLTPCELKSGQIMNELMIFNNPEFGEIRTIEENGKVLFCAKDVAAALGYKNTRDAINRHCKGVVKRDGVSHTTNQHGTTTEPRLLRWHSFQRATSIALPQSQSCLARNGLRAGFSMKSSLPSAGMAGTLPIRRT